MGKKILTLKNEEVLALSTWLGGKFLHGAKSRYRTRFLKLLAPRLDEMEKTRIEMLEEIAEKDDKGKPIVIDGRYKMSEAKNKKFSEEWLKYAKEEFVIDRLPSNNKEINAIKDILLNTDDEFSDALDQRGGFKNGLSATMYDNLCIAFEK